MKPTDEQIKNDMVERLSRDACFDASKISILVNDGDERLSDKHEWGSGVMKQPQTDN